MSKPRRTWSHHTKGNSTEQTSSVLRFARILSFLPQIPFYMLKPWDSVRDLVYLVICQFVSSETVKSFEIVSCAGKNYIHFRQLSRALPDYIHLGNRPHGNPYFQENVHAMQFLLLACTKLSSSRFPNDMGRHNLAAADSRIGRPLDLRNSVSSSEMLRLACMHHKQGRMLAIKIRMA